MAVDQRQGGLEQGPEGCLSIEGRLGQRGQKLLFDGGFSVGKQPEEEGVFGGVEVVEGTPGDAGCPAEFLDAGLFPAEGGEKVASCGFQVAVDDLALLVREGSNGLPPLSV